ncbi:tetratricopeptide repeat protein [Maribacter chungangensis]|uniref:Tetratricopeptide repeat protein n=1 Tax=Maribacter chungangensis TaxID=1069117 RepID=A0ABW3B4N2_9FLAO
MKKWLLLLLIISPLLATGQDQKRVDSLLRLVPQQKDSALIWTYRSLFNTYARKNPVKAKPYLDSAFAIAKKTKITTNLHGYLLYDLGKFNSNSGNYLPSVTAYKMAIDSFAKIRNKGMQEVCYNNMGIPLRHLGRFDEALECYMTSIRLSKELGDEEEIRASAYLNIGNIHTELGNFALSTEYFRKVEAVCLEFENPWGVAISRSNIATNFYKEKRYEEALELYSTSLKFFLENDYQVEAAEEYGHVGDVYFEMGSAEEALEYYNKAFKEAENINDKATMVIARRKIGNVRFKQRDYNEALQNYEKSLDLALLNGAKVEAKDNLLKIADTYAAMGHFKAAYNYRTRHFVAHDSIFEKNKIDQINLLEVQYQTEMKETEIALQKEEITTLNQEVEINTLKKGLYAGGMFSALALSGLLFFGFRQRMKKNRIAREKQEEIYKQEIEHKKKELASQTLHLVQKSRFISELKDNLEKVRSSPEKFKVEFKRIVMLLKKQSAADKDWEVFKSYFSEVHQDFDEKLKSLNSKITDKELRLASYVKMGLNNTEIADILNVLPSSIHTSKYRLKQKLNIDKKLEFDSFIKGL